MPETSSFAVDFSSLPDVSFILPEIILTLGLLSVLALTMYTYKKAREENEALMATSLVFVLAAFGALIWNFNHQPAMSPQPVLFGSMTSDLLSYLMRALLLTGAGLTIAVSHRFLEQNTRVIGDFYVLIMGATLGGMFLSSAADLITVFVGLETLSITSYILAGYLRRTARSAEASFKYLIYGGVGSSIFLFGLSLIYGLTGSTQFSEIAATLSQLRGVEHPTLVVMMLMVFATMAFKLSAVPFHMWTPDVYEGAPTPVSAFLSVVSKTAAMAITLRLVVLLFAGFDNWPLVWGVLSVVSMTLGNFVALKQKNVKRLLAYSTIAHAGYMLLAFTAATPGALGGLLYYLIAYAFMNLGAFACVIYFNTLTRTDDIEAYSGLVQKRPGLVMAFSVFLLSLAGIPITSGFFAKFFLFQTVALASSALLWLVVIALLNSTVSLAYYINLIRLMVVKEPSNAVKAIPSDSPVSMPLSTGIAVCMVVTVLLGIYATPFFQFSLVTAGQLKQQRSAFVSLVQDARK